jgi:hypothetical protein
VLHVPRCLRAVSDTLEQGPTDSDLRLVGQFLVWAAVFGVLGSLLLVVAILAGGFQLKMIWGVLLFAGVPLVVISVVL